VPFDGGQHLGTNRAQHRFVQPVRLGHHMVHRLMLRLHPLRLQPRSHWLDALAFAGQRQAGAVGLERAGTISVAEFRNQRIEVGVETGVTVTTLASKAHRRPPKGEGPVAGKSQSGLDLRSMDTRPESVSSFNALRGTGFRRVSRP
jgi:hypothetical protein